MKTDIPGTNGDLLVFNFVLNSTSVFYLYPAITRIASDGTIVWTKTFTNITPISPGPNHYPSMQMMDVSFDSNGDVIAIVSGIDADRMESDAGYFTGQNILHRDNWITKLNASDGTIKTTGFLYGGTGQERSEILAPGPNNTTVVGVNVTATNLDGNDIHPMNRHMSGVSYKGENALSEKIEIKRAIWQNIFLSAKAKKMKYSGLYVIFLNAR